MKPKLIDGFDTTDGTVGIIYADQASDLGGAEYVGVEKSGLSSGSIAYDKVLNTYVFNGENWVKDDGTLIPNKEGSLVEFASLTFTGEAGPPGYYIGQGDRTIPFIENAIVMFDGTEYEMERGVAGEHFYYGEFDGELPSFNTYPFATMGGGNLPTTIVGDANEHTISFSGNVSFAEVFDGNVTVSGGMAEISNSSLIEDKKSYKVVFDGTEYYGTAIYYYDDPNPSTQLTLIADPDGDNPLIGIENGVTKLFYGINGTYDLSLYEIVE